MAADHAGLFCELLNRHAVVKYAATEGVWKTLIGGLLVTPSGIEFSTDLRSFDLLMTCTLKHLYRLHHLYGRLSILILVRSSARAFPASDADRCKLPPFQ